MQEIVLQTEPEAQKIQRRKNILFVDQMSLLLSFLIQG